MATMDYLRAHATWSLEARVAHWKLHHPGRSLNRIRLARYYKAMRVKKKNLVQKQGNPALYTPAEVARRMRLMTQELVRLDRQGYEIF